MSVSENEVKQFGFTSVLGDAGLGLHLLGNIRAYALGTYVVTWRHSSLTCTGMPQADFSKAQASLSYRSVHPRGMPNKVLDCVNATPNMLASNLKWKVFFPGTRVTPYAVVVLSSC